MYNDSQSTAGIWQSTNFGTPFDFKWVRISLKTNNMSPVAVNGETNSTNTSQICWDGTHEILLPSGYDPSCIKYGSVKSVSVVDGGFGFTSTPSITIGAPTIGGGIQATAHAVMAPVSTAQVESVTVTSGGSGYLSAPTITFTGGGGTGAAAVATFVPPGAPVASLALNSSGTQCYSTAPTVSFVGGGGSGASATAALAGANSCIAGWTVSGNCNAHKGETISGVGLSGTTGSGFSGTLTFAASGGAVTGITMQNAGTGYTTVPTNLTGFSGCGSLTLTATLGKVVQSVSLTGGGSGYISTPTVAFSSGSGTSNASATATATLGAQPPNAGQVTGVTVTAGGSGYTSAPTVTFTSVSGTGAAGTATIGTVYSKVDTVVMDNKGKGYSTVPTVTFNGGGGSGAVGKANLGGGANWGKLYMVTALAQTKSGARAMLQMEASTAVSGFNTAAALTVDGPNPNMLNMPNSDNFVIQGHDQNSCSDPVSEVDHPAVGGYDDPNADPATHSVDSIVSSLPRPDHYTGDGPTPSVQNVFGGLGETLGTPTGLKSYIEAIRSQKDNPTNTAVLLGSAVDPKINYIDGDLTLNGNDSGWGILVVTGTLTMSGDFSWHGTVLIVGDGILDFSGGGTGTIRGTVLVAKIWDNYTNKNLLTTNGAPTVNWNGGGNNGIYYDHCWAEDLMSKIYYDAPVSTKPLKVLSLRTLPY